MCTQPSLEESIQPNLVLRQNYMEGCPLHCDVYLLTATVGFIVCYYIRMDMCGVQPKVPITDKVISWYTQQPNQIEMKDTKLIMQYIDFRDTTKPNQTSRFQDYQTEARPSN